MYKKNIEYINNTYYRVKNLLIEIDNWFEKQEQYENYESVVNSFNLDFKGIIYFHGEEKMIKFGYVFYEVSGHYTDNLIEELDIFNKMYEYSITIAKNDIDFILFQEGEYITNDMDNPKLKYSYFWYKQKYILGIQQSYTYDEFVPSIKPILFLIKDFDISKLPMGVFDIY